MDPIYTKKRRAVERRHKKQGIARKLQRVSSSHSVTTGQGKSTSRCCQANMQARGPNRAVGQMHVGQPFQGATLCTRSIPGCLLPMPTSLQESTGCRMKATHLWPLAYIVVWLWTRGREGKTSRRQAR
jgi:hypothetical protein